ncbi:MAG: hypothetical protein GF400_08035 [Candidatus Eisenbacteria bacterium]|nr:hypothetical protein [Candidatus Eisenbacteria bacterium]
MALRGKRRRRVTRALDGACVLGLVVLLLGLGFSEAAKSIGLALSVLALICRVAIGGRIDLRGGGTLFFLGLYVAATALSIAVAPAGLTSWDELLTVLITVAVFPVLADVCARRPSRRVVFTYVAIAGAAIAAVLGYADHMLGEYVRLVLPSIENAIPAGEYLAASIALTVSVLLIEAGASLVGPLLGLSLGLSVLVLFMTKSRGPVLGAAAGAITALGLGFRRRRVPALATALIVACAAVFGLSNPGSRLVKEGVLHSRSAENRLKTWRASADFISERPLLGHGAGSFASLNIRFTDEVGVEWEQNAHNVLLHELVETGVLGAFALVGFVVFGLRDIVRAVRRSRWRLDRAISAGSLAGVVSLLVCGLFSVSTDAEPGILFFALMALGASAPGAAGEDSEDD